MPKTFKDELRALDPFRFRSVSYSLEGEDLILLRLFLERHHGFYMDVGALHARRFSNTHLLSKKGWRGCNIEPNSELLKGFEKERPQDINLNIGISDQVGELEYFMFDEPALNTLDKPTAIQKENVLGYKLLGTKKIPVDRLENVIRKLKDHFGQKLTIDLLNIDVENHEWEVLNSNDWNQFRPEVICVEIHVKHIEELLQNRSYTFLTQHGYKLVAKTPMTCIFKDFERK